MSSSTSSTILNDSSTIMKGGDAAKAADYANYFCSYSFLYHQKQMLMDHTRMQAYYNAVMQNKHLFKGKVILDVGTGSGALAMWAAQAGAAKVYAVEFTDMAKHARKLVEANGLSDIVEVIQSSVEDLELPCKVDIIISEWMGYILLRESMLDSVLRARDRWMKPEGSMFPSHATMYWGAVSFEDDRESRIDEYQDSMKEWNEFNKDMKRCYNLEMDVLSETYEKEQKDYFIYSSLWCELKARHTVGEAVVIKRMDLNTCTLADAEGVDITPVDFTIPHPSLVSGFAGWFTVDFHGSTANPCTKQITLSTAPDNGYTHWGQQVFYLKNAIPCEPDTRIHGTIDMTRQTVNKRLYNLNMTLCVNEETEAKYVYEIP